MIIRYTVTVHYIKLEKRAWLLFSSVIFRKQSQHIGLKSIHGWLINPKYAKFVQDKIQPHIDLLNKNYALFKYKIDEYGDLVAYIPVIKNSKLWISLKEIES